MVVKLFGPPPLVRRNFLAMGTEITVTLAPQRRGQFRSVKRAMTELKILLRNFGHDGWAWGYGALAEFNRELGAGKAPTIPTSLRPLFDRAWEMRQASGGLFEPRVASLVYLWGFDSVERIRNEPPPPDEITAFMQALARAPDYTPNADHYGPAPNVGWDFGGIGKGYIVDQALDLLAAEGFVDATIDAGGNIAVRGQRRERSWRIGIRRPLAPDDDIDAPDLIAILDARDESVNTHGDDQRYFIHEGKRYAHILDPRSGQCASGLRSLTVVHSDGALAEAGGAALFVAGTNHWPALAKQLGIDQVLAVDDRGQIAVPPKLAARLQPEPGIAWRVIPAT
jgi:thiamine biosynthesis lipoprotein